MTTRTAERLQALSFILSDGLSYEWFRCIELDEDDCTAVILTDEVEEEGAFDQRHEIGPDDVARGLRMYREYLEGKREMFPGEWVYRARDAVRSGRIAKVEDFVGEVHARADADSYGWQTVEFDKTNGQDGDYDANTADSVLQFAIFGKVIYG